MKLNIKLKSMETENAVEMVNMGFDAGWVWVPFRLPSRIT